MTCKSNILHSWRNNTIHAFNKFIQNEYICPGFHYNTLQTVEKYFKVKFPCKSYKSLSKIINTSVKTCLHYYNSCWCTVLCTKFSKLAKRALKLSFPKWSAPDGHKSGPLILTEKNGQEKLVKISKNFKFTKLNRLVTSLVTVTKWVTVTESPEIGHKVSFIWRTLLKLSKDKVHKVSKMALLQKIILLTVG